MSSTLTVTNLTATNLTDGGGTTSTFANVNSGIAKAWMNYKGTATNTIRDSHNVSSVTDSGNGDYDMVFVSNMDNANYQFDMGTDTTANNLGFNRTATTGMAANEIRLLHYENGSTADTAIYTASVTGDLA